MSLMREIVEAGEDDIEADAKAGGGGVGGGGEKGMSLDAWIWSSIVEVAVAVGKGDSSVQALRWVLDSRMVQPGGLLHLLHVQPPLRFIPSPMGNNLPLESVSEDVANRHKMQRFLATERMLYQYKQMCEDRQVNTEVCSVEGDVIHEELVSQICSLHVSKLIIGASPSSRIARALKKQSVGSLVSKNAPDFCTVIVVCKGKVQSTREALKGN